MLGRLEETYWPAQPNAVTLKAPYARAELSTRGVPNHEAVELLGCGERFAGHTRYAAGVKRARDRHEKQCNEPRRVGGAD